MSSVTVLEAAMWL